MAKIKQPNLIASVKMLNIGVINKYTINLEIGVGSLELVNYQSFFSNLFSLAPSPALIIFLYKLYMKYCRLLHVSLIELYEFIIYQHLKYKRTKILPLATSQIAHLGNQLNHV